MKSRPGTDPARSTSPPQDPGTATGLAAPIPAEDSTPASSGSSSPRPLRLPLRLPHAVLEHPASWRRGWWLWFGLLFGFSSIPGNRMGPRPFEWFDKLEHAGFFFLGGLLLGGWLAATGRWPARWWLLPVVAALVGAFDETHQLFTPGRSGLDPADWAADIFGGSLAAVAVHLAYRRQAHD